MNKEKEILVCCNCGHEVDGPCICIYNDDPKYAFCGNCGDTGSHQRFTTADNWIEARKIMGLSHRINDWGMDD